MMDKPLIEVDTLVEADPKDVWNVLTQEKSAMFMGADVDTDWREGSPISFTGEFNGKPFKDHGEIREIDEPRTLAFTHFSPSSGKPDAPENYNLVRVTLAPEGDRTRTTLSQTPMGNGPAPNDETRAAFEKNWRAMLDGLKTAAEEATSANA